MRKTCGTCSNEQPLENFYSRGKSRPGHHVSVCKSCMSEKSKRRYKSNPAKYLAATAEYVAKNRIEVRARHQRWYEENKVHVNKRNNAYREANLAVFRAFTAKYRAQKKRATPAWANTFFIEEIYNLAALRQRLLKQPMEVDHIVPLQSGLVCGLHVETNLQIIPRKDNRSKSNVVWPDAP